MLCVYSLEIALGPADYVAGSASSLLFLPLNLFLFWLNSDPSFLGPAVTLKAFGSSPVPPGPALCSPALYSHPLAFRQFLAVRNPAVSTFSATGNVIKIHADCRLQPIHTVKSQLSQSRCVWRFFVFLFLTICSIFQISPLTSQGFSALKKLCFSDKIVSCSHIYLCFKILMLLLQQFPFAHITATPFPQLTSTACFSHGWIVCVCVCVSVCTHTPPKALLLSLSFSLALKKCGPRACSHLLHPASRS